MNAQILRECTSLAFEGKIAFPEVIGRMAATGVERYCADLVTFQKILYSADGQVHTEPIPLKDAPPIGQAFVQADVQAAIRSSQRSEIIYPEFLRRIMKAGTVYYDVFIAGRKVIYTGRDGDFHVENFPAAKP